MKFNLAAIVVLALPTVIDAQPGKNGNPNLQGKGNAYGRMRKPCTIVAIAELKIPGYESSGVRGLQSGSDPNGADEEFVCELDPDDAPNGHANQVVRLNLDESQKKKMHEGLYSGDLVSGSSTYYDPDAEVSSDEVSPGKVKVNGNGNAFGWTKNGKPGEGRRLGARTGDVRYLVVRVTDSGGLVRPENATQISDDVFGTLGDPVNLKSQAKACSYDQINIIPGGIHPGDEVAPGVIEVSVNLSLTNTNRYAFHNAVTAAVNTKLGISLPGPYEQVLYVLEKCYIECGWAAYAYINSWMSVYQGGYYKQTGVLMHELGHNWGMAHSGGLNGATYTDHTCLMGNPLYSDDVGKMCFNPAKNWYVGWYDDAKTLLDPLITSTWRENVVGIANYGNNPDNHSVVIKIETGTSTDYFIGFNRATGINSDNDEADNEVIIVETGNNGESYSQSFLKAHLIQGESYTFLNWKGTGEDLVITAKDINISVDPGYADIEIQLGTQTAAPTKAPTPVPNVAPTTSPTSSPTGSPTGSPTKGPTKAPNPTTSPTSSPTKPPTTSPTGNPTVSPTKGPTASPTDSPTGVPTLAPNTEPVWETIGFNGFEKVDASGECDYNGWVDPDPDNKATLITNTWGNVHSGNCALRLMNDESTSMVTSEMFNVTTYDSLKVVFQYKPRRMTGSSEEFYLYISTDNGNTYAREHTWTNAVTGSTSNVSEFTDSVYQEGIVDNIDVTDASDVTIRFVCNGSENANRVFLDDVVIEAMPASPPTKGPTTSPSASPSNVPTVARSAIPSGAPTTTRTGSPTVSPTKGPSATPSTSPSNSPTATTSASPTGIPTASPTDKPTTSPSASPSHVPTGALSDVPTGNPTTSPTGNPTSSPTKGPTASPSTSPTASPTKPPTTSPTGNPTVSPTEGPTNSPTDSPTGVPTLAPNTEPVWETIGFNGFEKVDEPGECDMNGWFDPGRDARLITNNWGNVHSDYCALRLQDSSSTSMVTSEMFNVTTYDSLKVVFQYKPKNMGSSEEFYLYISTDNGDTYALEHTWTNAVTESTSNVSEFTNNVYQEGIVQNIDVTNASDVSIRFVSNGDSKQSRVFLDDVVIEAT